MWKVAAELGLPRLVFINKLDRERASFERTLDAAAGTFGAGIAPLELPIGEEAAFAVSPTCCRTPAITYEGGKAATGADPRRTWGQEHRCTRRWSRASWSATTS